MHETQNATTTTKKPNKIKGTASDSIILWKCGAGYKKDTDNIIKYLFYQIINIQSVWEEQKHTNS